MRIIAGSAGGRRLQTPKGKGTRPTPDRVREALFSIIAADVPGAHVLDLFAGTGALGLEALSRGAADATFVDQDSRAAALVRENLSSLGFAGGEVLCLSAERAVAAMAARGRRFDLVFLDPPYAADLVGKTLQDLVRHGVLAPAALVVAEHATRTTAPSAPAGWAVVDARRYGDVSLAFYRSVGGLEP